MTTKQLRSFIRIAETGSFYKAADVLFVTPTALIQQINLLESEIGFRLFVRSHSGVTLTEAGAGFLEDVRTVDQLLSSAVEKGRQIADRTPRKIRVANIPLPASQIYLELLQRIRELQLPLSLELVSVPPVEALDQMRRRKLDLCILSPGTLVRRSGYPFRILRSLPVYIGFPSGHPLAGKDRLQISDLSGCTLVLPEEHLFDSADALRRALRDAGIPVKILIENDNLTTDAQCIRHMACRMATSVQQGSVLSYLPLEESIRFELCAVCHPDVQPLLSPLLDACAVSADHRQKT